MAYGTKVSFDELREVDYSAITGSFTALGDTLEDYTRQISFQNGTDNDVYISFDGSTNHLRIATNSFKLLDITANKVDENGFFISQGTQIYIKYVNALGSGTFWAEVMHASGGK